MLRADVGRPDSACRGLPRDVALPHPALASAAAGRLGPGLAAFCVAAATGRGRELLARITSWRLGLGWYAVALLGPGVLYAAAVALNTLLGGTPPSLPSLSPPLLLSLVLTLGLSLLSNWEEISWRGFLLPRLHEDSSPLEASLLLGAVSTTWHLPYPCGSASPLASTPLPAFVVFTLAGSVVLTWLYRGADNSALPAILLHAANTTWPVLIPSVPGETRPFELYAGLYAALALALVLGRRVPNTARAAEGTRA